MPDRPTPHTSTPATDTPIPRTSTPSANTPTPRTTTPAAPTHTHPPCAPTATDAPIPHTSATAADTPIPHTSPTATDTPPPRRTPATLWDPSTAIDPKIWRQIGLDPTTTTNTFGGAEPPYGFRLYSGHDTTRMYSVTVWSQIYTVEEFRRKESGAIFIPITIGTRTGFRYAPAADTTGDHCTLIFPAPHGSCSIQLIRQSTRAPMSPADKAIRIARLIVPFFPL